MSRSDICPGYILSNGAFRKKVVPSPRILRKYNWQCSKIIILAMSITEFEFLLVVCFVH